MSNQHDLVLQVLALALVVVIWTGFRISHRVRQSIDRVSGLEATWGASFRSERSRESYRSRADAEPPAGACALDDHTWIDLDFDEVVSGIDRTISGIGAQSLFRTMKAGGDDRAATRLKLAESLLGSPEASANSCGCGPTCNRRMSQTPAGYIRACGASLATVTRMDQQGLCDLAFEDKLEVVQVPPEHAWLFWDVDPENIDLERDGRYVLGRVLERGRMADVRWVIEHYGLDGVHDFFRTGAHPELSRATRSLWSAFFKEAGDEWPNPSSFRKNNAAPWID